MIGVSVLLAIVLRATGGVGRIAGFGFLAIYAIYIATMAIS
jgi:hypothetical protein